MGTDQSEAARKRRRLQNRAAQQRFRDKKSRVITVIRDHPVPTSPAGVYGLGDGLDDALVAELFDLSATPTLFNDLVPPQKDDGVAYHSNFAIRDDHLCSIDNNNVQRLYEISGDLLIPRHSNPINPPSPYSDPPTVPSITLTATTPFSSPRSPPRSHHPHSWQTPLHLAASKGHVRIVQTLLARQIDCNVQDSDGMTPLVRATVAGHEEVVRCLLTYGANVGAMDRHGRSSLHWAVLYRRGDLLNTLLSSVNRSEGRSIDCPDAEGMTPLHLAIELGFDEAVESLLQSGARADHKLIKF